MECVAQPSNETLARFLIGQKIRRRGTLCILDAKDQDLGRKTSLLSLQGMESKNGVSYGIIDS